MRLRSVLAMAFLGTFPACAGDGDDAAPALAAFGSFQQALQRGDATACRALVTAESRPAIDAIPWQDVRQKQPVVVLGADGSGAEFHIHVMDPNENGRRADFVVVREYGRFVVDLVASAGLTAEVVEATGSRDEFAPRELSPADFDRIRKYELAHPPR